jgi:deoxyadenosine/deoxycytidine kinase
MIGFIDPPDLLLYLKADVPKLADQIKKRGRGFEDSIKTDYLRNLNKHYEEWISQYGEGKILVIDMNQLDFAERPQDFSLIVEKIDLELNNLFES